MTEAEYKKDLSENGVDLPEVTEEPKAPEPEEPKADVPPEGETPAEPKPKRSIYDDYKEKKAEWKTEKERADHAEAERDELKARLEASSNADTPRAQADADEDAVAYASKIGADPDLVKRIIDDARKGFEVKPSTDPELIKKIEKFESWEVQNRQLLEKQMFDEEFTKVSPSIKELLKIKDDADLQLIKKELDTLSHTKEYHDKELEYVAFKEKDKLSLLVTPKKRGMEPKGRKDVDTSSFEFDPNAYPANGTLQEREAWEAAYNSMGKSEGLATGANGKKIII